MNPKPAFALLLLATMAGCMGFPPGFTSPPTAEAAPTWQFTIDEPNDKITVVSATQEADWQRVQFGSSPAAFRFRVNAGPIVPVDPSAWGRAANQPTPMHGGDIVTFCTQTETSDLSLTVRDEPASAILHTFTLVAVDSSC